MFSVPPESVIWAKCIARRRTRGVVSLRAYNNSLLMLCDEIYPQLPAPSLISLGLRETK